MILRQKKTFKEQKLFFLKHLMHAVESTDAESKEAVEVCAVLTITTTHNVPPTVAYTWHNICTRCSDSDFWILRHERHLCVPSDVNRSLFVFRRGSAISSSAIGRCAVTLGQNGSLCVLHFHTMLSESVAYSNSQKTPSGTFQKFQYVQNVARNLHHCSPWINLWRTRVKISGDVLHRPFPKICC